MAEVSAKSFLGLLQKSGLCEKARLKAALSELFRKIGSNSVSLDQLTDHLLENDLISQWHLKKLKSGKYKGFFIGKYKLLKHLGTGGMSTVYLAEHTIFNQKRALKVLPRDRISDKTFLQRFYREGRAAAALNHRNIVRVYDIDHEEDTHYLVMEFVRGEDIYEMVKRDGPLPCDRAIDYMIQTMTGLQHAHDNDLVHRDIKPANLLVTPDGNLKILDLGLALFQEDDASSLTVMHNERVLGTADYLSPEQAVDSHNLDFRADMYSAGCTLYFMLVGKPPFPDGTIAQRIARHLSKEPQPVSDFRDDCPAELLKILNRMMRKKPEERYADCKELANELRRVQDSFVIQSSGVSKKSPSIGNPGRAASKKVNQDSTTRRPTNQTSTAKPEMKAGADSKAASTAKSPPKPIALQKPKPLKEPKAVQKPKAAARNPVSKNNEAKRGPSTASRNARPTSGQGNGNQANRPVSAKKPTLNAGAGPEKNKVSNASKLNLKRSPRVDASEVGLVVPVKPDKSASVDIGQLQTLVPREEPVGKVSVKTRRQSGKNQALLVGFVVGMLLLLGLVLWIAVAWVNSANESAAQNGANQNTTHARFEIRGRLECGTGKARFFS